MDNARKAIFRTHLEAHRKLNGRRLPRKTITTYVGNIKRVEERITAIFEIATRGVQQEMINLDRLDRDGFIRLYRWFEYTARDENNGIPSPQHLVEFGLNRSNSVRGYRNSIRHYSVLRGHNNLFEDN